jgi:8-oxo-dGTP diphosphatase
VSSKIVFKAIIKNPEGKYLFLHRAADVKRWPGLWDLSGGAAEAGEDLEAALRREIREETGLVVQNVRPLGIVREKSGEHVISVLFICRVRSSDVTLSAEHDRYGWCTKEEFRKMEAPASFHRAVELV